MLFSRSSGNGPCSTMTTIFFFLAFTTTLCLAAPRQYPMLKVTVPQSHFEVLRMRQSIPLDPRAVSEIECIDRNAYVSIPLTA